MAVSQEVIDRIVGNVRKRYSGWEGVGDPRFQEEEIQPKREASVFAQQKLREFPLRPDNASQFLREVEAVAKKPGLLFARGKVGDLAPLYFARELGFEQELASALAPLFTIPRLGRELDRFLRTMSQHGSFTWPFLTLIPFLLRPHEALFVKPSVIEWIFQAVGDKDAYPREPSAAGYARILSLAGELRAQLVPHGVLDWIDFQSILWIAYAAEKEIGRRYWKIAPGEGSSQWDECRAGGFIAIGWDALGDLSRLRTAEVKARIAARLSKEPEWPGAQQVIEFLRIQPGDRIIANEGESRVLGFGEVVGVDLPRFRGHLDWAKMP